MQKNRSPPKDKMNRKEIKFPLKNLFLISIYMLKITEMKKNKIEFAIGSLKQKPLNHLWDDDDNVDNDYGDFEEEWLPQDAW